MTTLEKKLQARNEKMQKLNALKSVKKVTRTERKLGKENSFVLMILNAGKSGITVNEMLAENDKRENKTSQITINHNWNTFDYVQRGEKKLRAPWENEPKWVKLNKGLTEIQNTEITKFEGKTEKQILTEMKKIEVSNPAKCEVYFDVAFDFDINGKNVKNNHITIMDECVESLKAYLLTVGAKAEMFTV